jgi:hypothetical protein
MCLAAVEEVLGVVKTQALAMGRVAVWMAGVLIRIMSTVVITTVFRLTAVCYSFFWAEGFSGRF